MIYCLGAAAVLAAVYFILARKADEFIFHPVRGFLAGRLPGETFFLPSGNGKIQALYIPAREGKETLLFSTATAETFPILRRLRSVTPRTGWGC